MTDAIQNALILVLIGLVCVGIVTVANHFGATRNETVTGIGLFVAGVVLQRFARFI